MIDIHATLSELGIVRVLGYSLPGCEEEVLYNVQFLDGSVLTLIVVAGEWHV